MSTNGTAAYGMYPRSVALPEVVYALNRAGFGNEDICMVLSPAHPVVSVMRDARLPHIETEESANSARMIGWFFRIRCRHDSDCRFLHPFPGIFSCACD